MQNNEPKYRVAFTVTELQSLVEVAKLGDAIEMMPIVQKLNRAIAKANAGIIVPAYTGKTQLPGIATMARIANQDKFREGEELLHSLRAGQIVLTDNQKFLAMDHLIRELKQAPSHPKEIAALETYMTVSFTKTL